MDAPGIVVSALRGGAGKTILSIGIIAAWHNSGKSVAPFKKGPDYIDAGWLAIAAGQTCYNLDSYLIDPETVQFSYTSHCKDSDIAVVEGNRGLFDGIDVDGRTSTAEIAKLLKLPVIMCVDCTKTTRTMAAALLGCKHFDSEVDIKGVVLNRVAGPRHESILRNSIEHHCGINVVGAIPKLKTQDFPERHMGLVPTPEHTWAEKSIQAAADIARKYINLDALETMAREEAAPDVQSVSTPPSVHSHRASDPGPRIGVIRDSAFQFYYPDNIEALELAGAEIVYTSPLKESDLPDVDALYIGGGFPETHAEALSENKTYREKIKSLARQGFPIYAECGGLMYLGERLDLKEGSYPMTGVLPIVFGISKRPQGHGYTLSVVDQENPYFKKGTEIKGHEFRYSTVLAWQGQDTDMVFSTTRGTGFADKRDGILYKNVLASYTHIHALGTPSWAPAFVAQAIKYMRGKGLPG